MKMETQPRKTRSMKEILYYIFFSFSWPNNTRLLLTQAMGQWLSSLYSSPDYIPPVAVNI